MAYKCGYQTGYQDGCGTCSAVGYGGGWYGSEPYAGQGICSGGLNTEPVDVTSSNVLNIDDFVGRLGCGSPSFFITARCAKGMTCVLDGNVSTAKWDRRLDDISQAEVTVDLSGDSAAVCCQALAEVEPWCHELHIWRDNEEVWVGPIQELEYSAGQVLIRASDSLAWLNVRVPIVNLNHRAVVSGGAGPADLTTIATELLTYAYAIDGAAYTCVMDNLFSKPTTVSLELFYEAYNLTAIEILRKIAGLGLNFTTLGRTVVLVGSETPLVPLILLNDEHIIGNIIVIKDGTLQGNRFFIHFDGDNGVPVVGEATNFYCYNAIERIRSGDGLTNGFDAASVADAYASAAAIAPRMVQIPAGSKLSPDTPWTLDKMVPGTRVDVAVTRMCLNLTQSFILTSMEAIYNQADGESIGITLTPLNSSPVV